MATAIAGMAFTLLVMLLAPRLGYDDRPARTLLLRALLIFGSVTLVEVLLWLAVSWAIWNMGPRFTGSAGIHGYLFVTTLAVVVMQLYGLLCLYRAIVTMIDGSDVHPREAAGRPRFAGGEVDGGAAP